MKELRLPISAEERAPLLDARREAKMTASAHAYVRGSTKQYYKWLAGRSGRSLPKAPAIWISGDCHVGNFGPVGAKTGEIEIELRDLDQTVIGSPAHDVVRLALSMAMAVRASGLPGAVTARVVERIARGYEIVLEGRASHREFVLTKPPADVTKVLRAAGRRSRKELFAERVGKAPRIIPMGNRFWPLTTHEREAVEKLVETKKIRTLVTGLASRDDDADVSLVDAAYWVKGCSSLGLWRCAALLEIGSHKSLKNKATSTLALIDIKEARHALAPRSPSSPPLKHHGDRVVLGARALSPALGERMAYATLLDRDVFVRELLPQDLKFELSELTEKSACAVAYYLANVVAIAHARQLSVDDCAAWLEVFRKGHAPNMTAPAWLWHSTVDLVALHEAAYLEHCREHALHVSSIEGLQSELPTAHVSGD
jgi:uncharacterized protein (DUF2252 family)